MRHWEEIEPHLQTDMGYSRAGSDRYWLLVHDEPGPDGGLVIKTARGYLHGGLDDGTLAYHGLAEAKTAATHHELPLNLGDYWRIGGVPPRSPKFATSRRTLEYLGLPAGA